MTLKRIASAVLVLALSLLGSALGQKDSPAEKADEAAIHDYILSVGRLQVYAAAAQDFRSAKKDPALVNESQKLESANVSLLEKARLVETSAPHMNAWIKQHGMTAREFVLLPMTLITTGLAEVAIQQGGKPPAFVNPANLKFYEEHKADIDKLNLQADSEN